MKNFLNALWGLVRGLTDISDSLKEVATSLCALESKVDLLERDVALLAGKLSVIEQVVKR